tara:strand:+ start:805 stop:1896 length:1092 start_codon:yes stop_codon:yes gene_type:complete
VVSLFWSRLFIGLIAFTCTEIFAGSSAGSRLFTPWTFLVTYWLYFAHFFFFASLAYYTNRTSIRSLYLWGVLFGLYESWVTKVVWFGYAVDGAREYPTSCVIQNTDGTTPSFIMDTIGYNYGFCLQESFSMVFFWHPIFGFLIPLTAVLIFEPRLRESFQGLSWFQLETRSDKFMILFIILLIGSVLGMNSGGPHWAIITWIPVLAVLWLGYRDLVPTWQELEKPEHLVVLSHTGFKIATVYLFILYTSFYFIVFPYNETEVLGLDEPVLPGTPQKLIVFALYLITLSLIYFRGKPAPALSVHNTELEKKNMFRGLRGIVLLSTVMSAALILLPPLLVAVLILFIMLPVVSVGLFLRHSLYWR